MIFLVMNHEFEVVVIALAKPCGDEGAQREFAEGLFVEDILEMLKL